MSVVNDAGLLAALGVVSACVGGLIWVIKRMFNDILPVLHGLEKATVKNTDATKSADTYLRQRNGRDIEFHAETLKSIQAIPERMQTIADTQARAILKGVKDQTIQTQHVDKQVVEHKEDK